MDSSRSGLLSTLIMTVPLIVVPAIALLRPPVPHPGLASTELEASPDDDFFTGFDGIDAPGFGDPATPRKKPADSDDSADFSEIFDDHNTTDPSNSHSLSAKSAAPAFPVDPFTTQPNPAVSGDKPQEFPAGQPPTTLPPSNPDPGRDTVTESAVVQQLAALGVQRTLWFSPGDASFGFVAFVSEENIAGTGTSISYRFEAIGASRLDAVSQVRQQIDRWRQGQGQPSPGLRAN